MKKIQTIKKKEEFTEIIKGRQYIGTADLTFYYREKKEEKNRVGISVTTKLGNAVERNKAKRQLRAMIDDVFDWQESFDTIIVIKPSFKDRDFMTNKKNLESCYKKVRIDRVKDKGL